VNGDRAETEILDHSGDEFSTTFEACAALAIGDAKRIKVVVDLTTKGSVAALTCKLRTSSEATAPSNATATDWSTRQWHATAGDLTLTDYEPDVAVAAAGRFEFVFDVDGVWASPMVKVDAATSSRGKVYAYRSRKK
jgi:hypothetical protein